MVKSGEIYCPELEHPAPRQATRVKKEISQIKKINLEK